MIIKTQEEKKIDLFTLKNMPVYISVSKIPHSLNNNREGK